MKLTKRAIDAATYEGDGNSRHVLWDTDIPGFGCRLHASGRKTFVLSYRTDSGRKRLLTLGTYGVLTLDQARRAARAELAKLKGERIDPLEARQHAARGETIADFCPVYLERHASQKKTGDEDARRIDRYILPAWRNLKMSAIKRADIAALHSKIGKSAPYEANRTLALIGKMFELARRWGFLPEEHHNPARDIDKFREIKRDRWISPLELPLLAAAIDEEPNQIARGALWLYLLTGARKSELLNARWSDIDPERRELRLADTKAGRIHYIPLSDPALTLLEHLPRVPGNPYLFPGAGARPGKGQTRADIAATASEPRPLVNISKPWNRVKAAATIARWRQEPELAALIDRLTEERRRNRSKHTAADYEPLPDLKAIREAARAARLDVPPAIDDVRLHDLRRTVGSWLAQAGNSLHLIGRVLNHSNTSTTAIYARFGQDSVRTAMEQHGARLMGAAGLTPSAEVTELDPQAKARRSA